MTSKGDVAQMSGCVTLLQVIWDPYGVVDPYKDCPMALYHGCLHCLEKVELYMPDRVTCHFRYTQVIPEEPIKPTRKTYKCLSLKKYKVYYAYMLSQWFLRCEQILAPDVFGPPTQYL